MPSIARRDPTSAVTRVVTALVLLVCLTPPIHGQNSAASQDTLRPQLPVPPVVDSSSVAMETFLQGTIADTTVSVSSAGPSDPVELEAWMDGFIEAEMASDHVAGLTVSVVKDGALFFSKGYGFADVDARVPVDPATTLFRIGSVSKLFVWTSVMQLVERGMLDLDEDVNTYLTDLEVPAAYDEPVTLAHLLTHSPGFEDHVIGLFGDGEEDLLPLGRILAEQMPARVRPPGQVSSYSHHGTGLAMYIVETVSGLPWEQYIQENILDPLGMEHFTFSQPVPERLAADLSGGYRWSGGRFVEQDFEFVPLGPVGAAAASAADMATFMLAHLRLGEHEGGRILEESTALEMQSPLLRHAPGVNAMLHGFAELSRNGEWILGHGGDTFWFHSQFAFMPDRDLGIFISTNSESGNPTAILNEFVDRYFPAGDAALTPPADFSDRAGTFTGTYRSNRFSRTDATKLSALVGTVSVTDGGDGTLRLSSTGPARWIEIGPLTFQREHEATTIAFREADNGRMSHIFMGGTPYAALERVPTLEHPTLHAWLAGIAGLVFLLTVLLWPLAGFFRIRFGADRPEPRLSGLARFLAWSTALLFLAGIVPLVLSVSAANDIAMGNTGLLQTAMWILLAGTVLGIGTVLYAVFAWYEDLGTRSGRLALGLVGLVSLTFTWQLFVFNLLGWSL